MSTINLFTKQTDLKNLKSINPRYRSTEILIGDAILPEFDLHECDLGGIPVYGFAYQINDPNAHLVMASMTIPYYFDDMSGDGIKRDTIQGVFLISFGENIQNVSAFVNDAKVFGPYGCPKRVLTTKRFKSFFSFNGMRFYPFVMPNFTTGYYICDAGDGSTIPRQAWPEYDEKEDGVALDAPVVFDPTLGLYSTRSSHIEPRS